MEVGSARWGNLLFWLCRFLGQKRVFGICCFWHQSTIRTNRRPRRSTQLDSPAPRIRQILVLVRGQPLRSNSTAHRCFLRVIVLFVCSRICRPLNLLCILIVCSMRRICSGNNNRNTIEEFIILILVPGSRRPPPPACSTNEVQTAFGHACLLDSYPVLGLL